MAILSRRFENATTDYLAGTPAERHSVSLLLTSDCLDNEHVLLRNENSIIFCTRSHWHLRPRNLPRACRTIEAHVGALRKPPPPHAVATLHAQPQRRSQWLIVLRMPGHALARGVVHSPALESQKQSVRNIPIHHIKQRQIACQLTPAPKK